MAKTGLNRYSKIIERIFLEKYKKGDKQVKFSRNDLISKSKILKIDLPKNLGDIIYSFKYRASLPYSITKTSPKRKEWVIKNIGRGLYAFFLVEYSRIFPDNLLMEIKIPDSTPNIVAKYALTDEQALLTKLRYNRLLDIFAGVTCYSLQNHLRTTVPDVGQVETDEVYVGVDKNGSQFVFPIQAKGGSDELGIVQIEQDVLLCENKFPELICRAIAAQFMDSDLIAIFEFIRINSELKKVNEKHYRLVDNSKISSDDLKTYNSLFKSE